MDYKALIYLDIWTVLFTLLNFFLLMFILKKFLYKPVKKMLQQREDEVNKIYADANAENEQALKLKVEYESKIKQSKEEAAGIIDTAVKKAQDKSEEIIEQTGKRKEHMLNKAKEEITHERKLVMNEMKNQINDLVMMTSSKVIEKELNSNDHAKLIEDFIENVGENTWQN